MKLLEVYNRYRPVIAIISILLCLGTVLELYDSYLSYSVGSIVHVDASSLLLLVAPSIFFLASFLIGLIALVREYLHIASTDMSGLDKLKELSSRLLLMFQINAEISMLASSLDRIELFPIAILMSELTLLFYIFLASLTPLLYIGISYLLGEYGYTLPMIITSILYATSGVLILFSVILYIYISFRRAVEIIREVEEKYGYLEAIGKS